MSGIAAARVTAGPAGQLPGVGRTAVAVLPEHIGKTQALARGSVAPAVGAVAVLLPRAQGIADTLWKRTVRSHLLTLNKLLESVKYADDTEVSYVLMAKIGPPQVLAWRCKQEGKERGRLGGSVG